MDELFVATEQGNIPIEQLGAEKYKGKKTPYTNSMILDKNDGHTRAAKERNY